MIYDGHFQGERVLLRNICIEDCNNVYLSWLGDPEINKYLESRWQQQKIESLEEYVNTMLLSPNNYLFAIIDLASDAHIGNIRIGPIDTKNKNAEIGYFIGDKAYWGRGVASESVRLVADFAFSKLALHRLQAGVIEDNTGSIHLLKKEGFALEGRLVEKGLVDGIYRDHLVFGKIAPIS